MAVGVEKISGHSGPTPDQQMRENSQGQSKKEPAAEGNFKADF